MEALSSDERTAILDAYTYAVADPKKGRQALWECITEVEHKVTRALAARAAPDAPTTGERTTMTDFELQARDLTDHEITARMVALMDVTNDEQYGDDALSSSGWAEYYALEAEQHRRETQEFLANRQRGDDDGVYDGTEKP